MQKIINLVFMEGLLTITIATFLCEDVIWVNFKCL